MKTNKGRFQRWSDTAQRYTNLTLEWDDHGKLLTNTRAVASHSSVGWGRWQTSRKIKCSYGDCWDVSTAGHGGYILVTQTKLPFVDETHKHSFMHDLSGELSDGRVFPLYVYEFEEDCAWAVLLYHDPVALADSVTERNRWMTERGDEPTTVQQFTNEYVIPTLQSYYPNYLQNAA